MYNISEKENYKMFPIKWALQEDSIIDLQMYTFLWNKPVWECIWYVVTLTHIEYNSMYKSSLKYFANLYFIPKWFSKFQKDPDNFFSRRTLSIKRKSTLVGAVLGKGLHGNAQINK